MDERNLSTKSSYPTVIYDSVPSLVIYDSIPEYKPSQSKITSQKETVSQNKNTDYCDKIILWSQFGPICWFNAILTIMFRSQRNVQLLQNTLFPNNLKTSFEKLVYHIINYKLINSKDIIKDKAFINKIKPDKILDLLHKEHPDKFGKYLRYGGGNGRSIISKLYELLRLKCIILEYNNKKLYYSKFNILNTCKYVTNFDTDTNTIFNWEMEKPDGNNVNLKQNLEKNLENPDVIIIVMNDINKKNLNHKKEKILQEFDKKINSKIELDKLDKLEDKIVYDKINYTQDAVFLVNYNYNKNKLRHAIAGITCNNSRYVYNGWSIETQNQLDKEPCNLIKHNWDINTSKKFCLSKTYCGLTDIDENDLCFDFSQGLRYIYYIKDNSTNNINIPSTSKSFQSMSVIDSVFNKSSPKKKLYFGLKEILDRIFNLAKKIFDYETKNETNYKTYLKNIFNYKQQKNKAQDKNDIMIELNYWVEESPKYDLTRYITKIQEGGGNPQKLQKEIINALNSIKTDLSNLDDQHIKDIADNLRDNETLNIKRIKQIDLIKLLFPILKSIYDELLKLIAIQFINKENNILLLYLQLFNEIYNHIFIISYYKYII
jgi:hypothetical protein